MRSELVDDLTKPSSCLAGSGGKDPADGARHQRLLGPADMAEHVAQEVDGAALPRAAQHLGDRGLEASVGVRDAQPDPVQPAGAQAAEELAPEAFGLGLADTSRPTTSRRPLWCTP